MFRTCSAIFITSAVLCGSVLASNPTVRQTINKKKASLNKLAADHLTVKKPKKVWPVYLGKPIQAVAVDTVMSNGHMSVIVGDGQFAEVLFQPFTRTRYEGDLVSADHVPDGERMVIWGKWDRHDPNVFKALAVSCREHLSDIAVRQRISMACQNITRRRTLASIPEPERHVVIMTAPAPTVAIPEVNVPSATVPTAPPAATPARPVAILPTPEPKAPSSDNQK